MGRRRNENAKMNESEANKNFLYLKITRKMFYILKGSLVLESRRKENAKMDVKCQPSDGRKKMGDYENR